MALALELPRRMSPPAVVVGGVWSQKSFWNSQFADSRKRSELLLHENTLPPVLPSAPPPKSPPAVPSAAPVGLWVTVLPSAFTVAPPWIWRPDPPVGPAPLPVTTVPVMS